MLKVEVISTKMIKPSSPTPLHLRSFKLSLIDQLAPPLHYPLLLFYTTNKRTNPIVELSQKLKTSLSETLTSLYPLAGRMKEDDTIDCTDEGAEFSHAQVNGQLAEFLKQPHVEVLDQLLPCDILRPKSGADVPLAIQFNAFECGGVAIGMRLSHKVADAAALASFVTKWAAISRGDMQSMDDVTLVSDSLFPPRPSVPSFIYALGENVVTRRVVFDASAISALKTRAAGDPSLGSNPTRVEVVSALIWRCFMKALQNGRHASVSVSVSSQTVNLRGRMVPPVPDSHFGNLWVRTVTNGVVVNECNDKIHGCFEKEIRDSIREIDANFIEGLQGADGALKAHQKFKTVTENCLESRIHIFHFTSWCWFPLYDMDFGWGKPAWVSSCNVPVNIAFLFGTRGGDGIEAWVNMEAEEMAKFEQDQELLSFAAIP